MEEGEVVLEEGEVTVGRDSLVNLLSQLMKLELDIAPTLS